MSVNPEEMKATLRQWASGVTVVTTANDEIRAATTASSFSSVSLEPPLILVCLHQKTATVTQITENKHFAVSILGTDHENISSQMAGYVETPEGEDQFYGLEWITAETGSPIYADAIGWLDCKLHAIYDGGTHKIILGEIVAAGSKDDAQQPLIYFNRAYRKLSDI